MVACREIVNTQLRLRLKLTENLVAAGHRAVVLFAGGGWLIPPIPTESSGICVDSAITYKKEQALSVDVHKPAEPGNTRGSVQLPRSSPGGPAPKCSAVESLPLWKQTQSPLSLKVGNSNEM